MKGKNKSWRLPLKVAAQERKPTACTCYNSLSKKYFYVPSHKFSLTFFRMFSLDHRRVEAGRALWSPPGPTPAPAEPPSPGCPGPSPGSFWRSPRRRPHSLSGQPVPGLCHQHSTEVLPGAQREPPGCQFVPSASCPGTGHH